MAYDALKALRESGNPIDVFNAQQQRVLGSLTEDEVNLFISVKSRLDAVAGDVEGQDVNFIL